MTPTMPTKEEIARDVEAEVAAAVKSRADLMEMAYVLESEAADRYAELADQMEVHNNHEVAEVFAKMAAIEGEHAKKVDLQPSEGPKRAPWEYRWIGFEAPETTSNEDLHYLMTPHHALTMMLGAEERALKFYDNLAQTTPDGPVKNLAQEFAEEEREHVRLVGTFTPPPAAVHAEAAHVNKRDYLTSHLYVWLDEIPPNQSVDLLVEYEVADGLTSVPKGQQLRTLAEPDL